MLIELHCLRHGQPEERSCLLGRTDCALTKQGWQDMKRAVGKLPTFDIITTSPLRRCRAFAEDLAALCKVPIVVSSSFAEMDFGDWDGLSWERLAKEEPKKLARFWKEPAAVPPNGEQLAHFISRVREGCQKLVARLRGTALSTGKDLQRCLLVSHGGVIKTLVAHALGIPMEDGSFVRRLDLSYASHTHLSLFVDDERSWWRLHKLS